jgi:hypothetical protein
MRCCRRSPFRWQLTESAVRPLHNPPMHRTGPAVSFLSVERGSAPARPVIGPTLCGGEHREAESTTARGNSVVATLCGSANLVGAQLSPQRRCGAFVRRHLMARRFAEWQESVVVDHGVGTGYDPLLRIDQRGRGRRSPRHFTAAALDAPDIHAGHGLGRQLHASRARLRVGDDPLRSGPVAPDLAVQNRRPVLVSRHPLRHDPGCGDRSTLPPPPSHSERALPGLRLRYSRDSRSLPGVRNHRGETGRRITRQCTGPCRRYSFCRSSAARRRPGR